jgi:hypothetical protein
LFISQYFVESANGFLKGLFEPGRALSFAFTRVLADTAVATLIRTTPATGTSVNARIAFFTACSTSRTTCSAYAPGSTCAWNRTADTADATSVTAASSAAGRTTAATAATAA